MILVTSQVLIIFNIVLIVDQPMLVANAQHMENRVLIVEGITISKKYVDKNVTYLIDQLIRLLITILA